MMKLSELMAGDKFRRHGETKVFEMLCSRVRGDDGVTEWSYWSKSTGFHITSLDFSVQLVPDPQYRPYSDLRVLVGEQIKHSNGATALITWAVADKLFIGPFDRIEISARELLDEWVHLGGTPCGELVE